MLTPQRVLVSIVSLFGTNSFTMAEVVAGIGRVERHLKILVAIGALSVAKVGRKYVYKVTLTQETTDAASNT